MYLHNHKYSDFNLPGIFWDNGVNELTYFFLPPINAHCIPETFALRSLKKNNIVNSNGFLLDLVFSYASSLIVDKSEEPIVPINLYNRALYFTIFTRFLL